MHFLQHFTIVHTCIGNTEGERGAKELMELKAVENSVCSSSGINFRTIVKFIVKFRDLPVVWGKISRSLEHKGTQ